MARWSDEVADLEELIEESLKQAEAQVVEIPPTVVGEWPVYDEALGG